MREKITLVLLLVVMTSLQSFAAIGKKDTVMVFRPGPGVNDSSDRGTANAGMDAIVYEGNPGGNYATYQGIAVLPISNCNNTHETAFMRFDLGTLPDTVDSVFLVIKHVPQTSYCYSNCSADFYFYPVLQNWYEPAITYNNQPSVDTAFYGPISMSFPNTWDVREYNITKMYRMWRDSVIPNYGMQIASPTVGCNNAAIGFFAHNSDDPDSTKRPYLKIYYRVDTGHVDTPIHISTIGISKPVMKMYPNPAHNEITMQLQATAAGGGWYVITDITGRVVRLENIQWLAGDNNTMIPLYNLDAGLYYYTLYTPEGKLIEKILKQ
ncbi:MAG: T9SS type A sorting domain-containing protein [Bacteroidetes bacterium]|nr:T9SS type A sorting domain-containing protein [Bacteroidota bacterium]